MSSSFTLKLLLPDMCLLEFIQEKLRMTQITFLWLKSCLDSNKPNQAWCYQMLRNEELSWCLVGTEGQRKARHGPGGTELGEGVLWCPDLLGSLQQQWFMRVIWSDAVQGRGAREKNWTQVLVQSWAGKLCHKYRPKSQAWRQQKRKEMGVRDSVKIWRSVFRCFNMVLAKLCNI